MMKQYNLFRDIAAKAHADTHHMYDGKPYVFHLDMCVDVAREFAYLIPEQHYIAVETGIYFHDVIEDARWTYNDLFKVTNNLISTKISYALTNNKGKTREERANENYYQGIRDTEYATFGKLCDRIANMKYSKNTGSSMFKKYIKEYFHFKSQLYDEKYKDMFNYIENVIIAS